jgi:hypothetical protein
MFAEYIDFEDDLENKEGPKIVDKKEALNLLVKISGNKDVICEPPYFLTKVSINIMERKETIDAVAYIMPKIINKRCMSILDIATGMRIYGFRFRGMHNPTTMIFVADACFYCLILMKWIHAPAIEVKQKPKINVYEKIDFKSLPGRIITPSADRGVTVEEEDSNLMARESADYDFLKTPAPIIDGTGNMSEI